jgi:hypothetical protein
VLAFRKTARPPCIREIAAFGDLVAKARQCLEHIMPPDRRQRALTSVRCVAGATPTRA